jgi:hypothetical protein
MKYAIAMLVALLLGCSEAVPPTPTKPVAIPTPGFDSHCKTCKQCGGGLLDENGQEQGLCEEGFRLWQQDLRDGKGL